MREKNLIPPGTHPFKAGDRILHLTPVEMAGKLYPQITDFDQNWDDKADASHNWKVSPFHLIQTIEDIKHLTGNNLSALVSVDSTLTEGTVKNTISRVQERAENRQIELLAEARNTFVTLKKAADIAFAINKETSVPAEDARWLLAMNKHAITMANDISRLLTEATGHADYTFLSKPSEIVREIHWDYGEDEKPTNPRPTGRALHDKASDVTHGMVLCIRAAASSLQRAQKALDAKNSDSQRQV